MTEVEFKKVYEIADELGEEEILLQLSEECAEIIQAVSKDHRFRESKTTRDEILTSTNDSNMLIQNICEEIADVEIMLDQMKYLLNINPEAIEEIKINKINRQLERIEKEKA